MIVGTEVGSLADVVETIQADKGDKVETSFESLRLTKHARKLAHAGFRHIELALDTRFTVPGSADNGVIHELLELRRAKGISYSVHLPIYDTSFMSLNERIRKATLECLKEVIVATEPLEITGYILHPTRYVENEIASLPFAASTKRKIYNYILGIGGLGLSELIDAAGDPMKILLEPDCAIPFDAIIDPLVQKYDVGICFDYGHHVMFKMNPYKFFDERKDRVKEIHFHDVQVQYKIDHLPLGAGTTEWVQFIRHITRKNGFDGVLLLEMMQSAAIMSLPKLLSVLEKQR
ncbi:MAG: cobamide remodeling phosphodiesterase CbiR [Candidatus Atabeyarchaeum deiterrae]